MFYAVAWLDRASEIGALAAAVTWRRLSTVVCLNLAATGFLNDEGDDSNGPSVADVPWHAYLIAAFPVIQFATAVQNAIVSPGRDGGVWQVAVAAAASCAPAAAHGTATALLVVANGGMRAINHRITRLRLSTVHRDNRSADFGRLARRHWRTTELVTGGVCRAYGVDLMMGFLLAAVRVTYVAVAVFHSLTADADQDAARTTAMSPLAVFMQLIAWFGQFVYLAYTCDELTAQVRYTYRNALAHIRVDWGLSVQSPGSGGGKAKNIS